jgi:hypothetical protein
LLVDGGAVGEFPWRTLLENREISGNSAPAEGETCCGLGRRFDHER